MSIALIVDDSPTEREIISSCLKEIGLSVLTANSGEEGIEKASAQKPDLILLDVVLPGRSGFEVCRELKAEDNTKNIPVILCSTKNTEMDKFWGMKQGADAYVTKPIDKVELVRIIKKLLPG
jgi:chemotaxis family two-component system response regulator PixH